MARIKICKETGCDNEATTSGYCRLHYLKNWQKIKKADKERAAKRLNAYVEAVCKKHPEKYVEVIKRDLKSPLFGKYVDENFAFDDDDVNQIFNQPTYDEEIEQLLKDLKISDEY